MEQYRRVEKQKVEDQIKDNEIRVTTQGKMRSFISYATTLLKEKGFSEIVLKAMGRAINKTVTIAEIIKRRIPDLHQITEIDSTDITDVWEPLQEGLDRLEMTRHVSSIQIRLSTKELDTTSPGYQPPLPQDQVKPVDEETTAALEIEVGEKPRRRGRGGRGRGGRGGRGGHSEGQDSPQEEHSSPAPRRHNNNTNVNNNNNTNNVTDETAEGRGRGGRRRRGRGRGGRGGNAEGAVHEQFNDEHVESGEQTRGGRGRGRGGRGGRGRGGRGGRADEGARAPVENSEIDAGQGPSFRRGRRGGRGGRGRGGRGRGGRDESTSQFPNQH